MKRYDTYKDSGVEWIGEIPSHWLMIKPWTIFSPEKRPTLPDDEIITCFRDGIVTLRKNRREDGFTNSIKEIGYQRIHKGDLVVHEMDGFEGSIGVSDSFGKSTPVYTVIKESNSHNNRFWMFLLREMSNTRYIECLSKSIRERTTEFRWNTWKTEFFPSPPLSEQQQIVSFLDTKTSLIDSLIEKTQRKIELLKEKRTSLINEVVNKGLNPNVEMKDSGVEWIGKIPSHWEKISLGKLGVLYGGLTGKSGDDFRSDDHPSNKPFIPFTNIFNNTYISKDHFQFVVVGDDENQNRVEKFDLFFLMSSEDYDDLGKSSIIIEDVGEVYLNSFCKGFRVNRTDVYPLFLNYQLLGDTHKKLISIEGNGFTRINLRQDRLKETPMFIPPLYEQQQIVSYLDEQTHLIDKTVSIEEKRIELLKEYRQSLISEVVTGKLKVTTDE